MFSPINLEDNYKYQLLMKYSPDKKFADIAKYGKKQTMCKNLTAFHPETGYGLIFKSRVLY